MMIIDQGIIGKFYLILILHVYEYTRGTNHGRS